MDSERLTLTIPEAAKMAGTGISLAYRLANNGQWPGVFRFGTKILLSRVKFEAFLNGEDGHGT